MRLYIVRHGETDWNKEKLVQGRRDIPLNAYGRHLAEETREGFLKYPLDLAYTSPLSRAKETAEILLRGRGIPMYEEERIQEISFGSYEGMSCIDKTKPENRAFQKFFRDTGNYVAPSDGETVEQLYERTGDFLRELTHKEELQEKNILVSTHGAAMTAMLNRMKGNLSVEQFWKEEVPPNCSVTIVEWQGGSWKILQEGLVFYKEAVKHWSAV